MSVTTDPNDPRLSAGIDDTTVPQAAAYLVLTDEERAQKYVRPLRFSYLHTVCGEITTMSDAIAQTYARQPTFYGATYCATCHMHRPVGKDGEFVWVIAGGPSHIHVGT